MTESSNPLPPVLFIHVLKTVGSNFRRLLSNVYGDSFQLCMDSSMAGNQSALAQFRAVEFHVKTHGELGEQRRWDILAGRNIFAIFRAPVDQYLSYYHHADRARHLVGPDPGRFTR
jgi:hypothetical protein